MTTSPPPLQTRWQWPAVIVLVVVATLAGLAWLQSRQLSELDEALRSGNDLRVVEMQRQETEYLQLREQWQRALDEATPLDLRGLSLRYDIWVGRMAMLKDNTATRRTALASLPELDDTLRQVEVFVTQTDAALSESQPARERRARLAALHPQLLALGDPIHELAMLAAHRVTHEQTGLHLMLARHTRHTLALTAALSVLVLVLAGLGLRQMALLSRRHHEMLRLSADVQLARAAADAANQAKSRFLADMSHEMRTPFQGVLGMLSVLRASQLDARQAEALRTATDSADHVLVILNDILDLSLLEAGRLQIKPETLALRPLLQDVQALMAPLAMAQQLELQLLVDTQVPAWASVDGTRIKQVLINLLSNAIKYAERGPITLELTRRQDAGTQRLLFCVTDRGPGMDSATLSLLFKRYERADAAGRSGNQGAGLGLQISRGLAHLMNGDLQVSSEPGHGSRFVFSVPLQQPLAAPTVVLPLVPPGLPPALPPGLLPVVSPLRGPGLHHPLPAAAGEEAALPAPPRLQVLVAEDHPVNRQVLAALLDSMGHHSHFVADGQEAVAAVQRATYDLVLMDLHMPGLDGIAATRLIRALTDRAAATVPIVALTADAFTDTRDRCLVAGMNDFLSKPVGRDRLGALLRQLFGSGSGVAPVAMRDPMQSRPSEDHPDMVRLLDPVRSADLRQSMGTAAHSALLADYFDRAAMAVDALRQAMRAAQPLDLREQAHKAQVAAAELGLSGLAATALALQDGAAHLPAHELARLVQRFEAQMLATQAAARQAGLVHQDPVTR